MILTANQFPVFVCFIPFLNASCTTWRLHDPTFSNMEYCSFELLSSAIESNSFQLTFGPSIDIWISFFKSNCSVASSNIFKPLAVVCPRNKEVRNLLSTLSFLKYLTVKSIYSFCSSWLYDSSKETTKHDAFFISEVWCNSKTDEIWEFSWTQLMCWAILLLGNIALKTSVISWAEL